MGWTLRIVSNWGELSFYISVSTSYCHANPNRKHRLGWGSAYSQEQCPVSFSNQHSRRWGRGCPPKRRSLDKAPQYPIQPLTDLSLKLASVTYSQVAFME
jgi:hypothetical protein